MLSIHSRETIIQSLQDVGCDEKRIAEFLRYLDTDKKEKQLELLEYHRKELLDQIHREEKKISCLDYLVYQIQRRVF